MGIDFRIMVQITSKVTQRGYMTKPSSHKMNRLLPVLDVMSHVRMMRVSRCSGVAESREGEGSGS